MLKPASNSESVNMLFPPLIILWLFGLTNSLPGRATAILQFNTSNCLASCTVRPPRVESVGWKKIEASTRTTLAAFTVVAIINTQQNLTRYTTKTAQLPAGYTIPPLNQNGTRLCVIEGSKITDQPVTLPFPTFRKSTDSIYDWYGQLPTTVSNATISACLSTSTFATFHNPLPISQYIPNDIPISDDPYGLNYECTSLNTVAGQIYTTEDKAAFRSCDTFTNTETTYYSTGYLETAAWLTIASSTSYEVDISTEMASQASTSDKSISPVPHSTMAPQTTTVHSSKGSQPSYLQSTVKTSGSVPSKSTPTLRPTLDSDSEHTDFPFPPTSQALAAGVNAGGANPSQSASTEAEQTVKASSAPARPSAGDSSLGASAGIEAVNSGSSPIATTSLSTSTMYNTSFRTSVTTDEQGSTSEKVSVGITVVPITSARIPGTSAAAASNPAGSPSVPTFSSIQSATSTPTSFGESSDFVTGEGGSSSATTDASRSETHTEVGDSPTGVPAWNSAAKADHMTGYGLICFWLGLLLAF